jgi:hypothetical protein
MASFYVLTPPASDDPDMDTVFVRDGFSWAGFLLPVPWLVYRRLWLIAALAVLVFACAVLAHRTWRLEAVPAAYSLVLSLWVGFEGGYMRSQHLQAQGWTLTGIITAPSLEDAEYRYFAEKWQDEIDLSQADIRLADRIATKTAPQRPAASTLALGLIEPSRGR